MRQARLRLAHARAGIKRHDSSEVENNLYIPWERESSWEECILLKKNRPNIDNRDCACRLYDYAFTSN